MHRHPVPFIKEAMRIFIMALVPAALAWGWMVGLGWYPDSGSLGYAIIVMLGALYYIFLAILLYGFWLNYYLDMFIVTNKRVVDVEQRGLLSRTVSEQPLYRIQDVTSEVDGAMAHLFRYGNVYIQTAGEKERFIFEQIDNPELVVRTILSLTDNIVRTKTPSPATQERLGKI